MRFDKISGIDSFIGLRRIVYPKSVVPVHKAYGACKILLCFGIRIGCNRRRTDIASAVRAKRCRCDKLRLAFGRHFSALSHNVGDQSPHNKIQVARRVAGHRNIAEFSAVYTFVLRNRVKRVEKRGGKKRCRLGIYCVKLGAPLRVLLADDHSAYIFSRRLPEKG